MAENETDLRERPPQELVKEFSEQTSRLVRQELALATAELQQKGKQAGIGAGMFGGAGAVGMYAVGALTATIILLLSTFMAAWLGALIVTVIYGAVAALLALRGRAEVQQAAPPVPQQAVESSKEDARWVKNKAQSARQ